MEKESKVKLIVPFAQKAGARDYTFSLEFENGDKGFYHNPTAEQNYFILGSLVKYELEVKTKKDGSGSYNVIYQAGAKPEPKQRGYYNNNEKKPKTPLEIKRESRTMLLRYVVDMAIADKIKTEEIPVKFHNLTKILDESIDKLGDSPATTV